MCSVQKVRWQNPCPPMFIYVCVLLNSWLSTAVHATHKDHTWLWGAWAEASFLHKLWSPELAPVERMKPLLSLPLEHHPDSLRLLLRPHLRPRLLPISLPPPLPLNFLLLSPTPFPSSPPSSLVSAFLMTSLMAVVEGKDTAFCWCCFLRRPDYDTVTLGY